MKYSELLGLQDYFHPIFNIENETLNYWKQFIPNEQFNEVFRKTLNAIDTMDPGNRKSIWIQGTYGTGKSHAASVIKHLLWDDKNEITDYIEERFTDVSLKAKLFSFRSEKKLLPIVIKGVGNIINHRTFALQIERSVKGVLQQLKIDIPAISDFDRLIDKVNNAPINWSAIIEKYDELNILINDASDIIKKLNSYDIDFFRTLEDVLSMEDINFSHDEISKWLLEINNELAKQKIADGIVIYWDEFTSVMDTISSGIIDQIQHIAELSEKNNVYLYLISHRTPSTHQISKEDIKRMNDRFHILQYRMEPITTYHIINATIKKYDITQWEDLRNQHYLSTPALEDLTTFLTNNHGAAVKSRIKDLFPIHPYTAFLSTFIARNLGSTNRSIFEFLYDHELGFLAFINQELNGYKLLTVDYLWDYFATSFENDNDGRFTQALDKYRINVSKVSEKGENFTKVFKGILLLNVLYKVIEINEEGGSPVTPSSSNIISLFIGTNIQNDIHDILTYIDESGIISKTPAGDYLIEFSSLPIREIENQKENIRNQYKDITNVLKYGQFDKELEKNLFNDQIYRESEVAIFSSKIDNEHILRNKISKAFSKPYSVKIVAFVHKEAYDNDLLDLKLKDLLTEDEYQNIIFVSILEPLSEKNFDKFVDYMARKLVSDNHNNSDQSASYDTNAKGQVKEWVSRIRSRFVQVKFRAKSETFIANQVGKFINKQISPIIFYKGIDNIPDIYRYANFWKFQNAIKSAEIFLFSDDRQEFEEKTSKFPYLYLRDLVKDTSGDYIVTESFDFKPDTNNSHSLRVIQEEVDKLLDKVKQRSMFNLGDELKPLFAAPFGIYTNMPNMAALGYVLRKYSGELYMADVGRPIQKEEMRDLVGDVLTYWQESKNQGKLNVRFGSKEERDLKEIISKIFSIEGAESITDARWHIREFLKKVVGYPLWSLKYNINFSNLIDTLDEIIKLVSSLTSEIDLKLVKSVLARIKDSRIDLTVAVSQNNNFKEGFNNFLLQIDAEISISESEIPEIEQFLQTNMQEEVGLWSQETVKNKVYAWYMQKIKQNAPNPTSPTTPDTGPKTPVTPVTPEFPDTARKEVITKITSFNQGEAALKEKILLILEENPNLISIFSSYFN